MKKSGPHNRFKLENLEPRILLSADTALAATAIDLPEETESGMDIDFLPLEEVALGDEDRLEENPYQNQSTYDPSQSLDDIFAGLSEDNLIDLSEDEDDSESENEHDDTHRFEDDFDHDQSKVLEDEDEHEDEDDNSSYGVSVITPHQQDQIVRGLKALSQLGGVMENFDAFASKLTQTIDQTVGGFIGFVEIFDTRLAKPVHDYFNDAVDPPDTQGVLQTIEDIRRQSGDLELVVESLDGGKALSQNTLQFDLKIEAARTGKVYPENTVIDVAVDSKEIQSVAEIAAESKATSAPPADELQSKIKTAPFREGEVFAVDANGKKSDIFILNQEVDRVRVVLDIDFSFGVDLSNSDEFFIVIRQFDVQLIIDSRAKTAGRNPDMARAPPDDRIGIADSNLLISVRLNDAITGDGRITIDELEAINSKTIEDFVVLMVGGSFYNDFVPAETPQAEPTNSINSISAHQSETEPLAFSVSDSATDIRQLQAPILDLFQALSEQADAIKNFEELNVDLPIIDRTINQLVFADPDAGIGAAFDFFSPALDYFNLLDVFNLDLSDELTLKKLGTLSEIITPQLDLENVTHRRRLGELIESKYELALAPDWDINLYLPEIFSLLDEDFQTDKYLPEFQLLLGLPYLPRWDQIRSDMKSYFDSSANLRGLQDYIRTVSIEPLYQDFEGRTTAEPFTFSGGYLPDTDEVRFDFFTDATREIDFTVDLQSLLEDQFSDPGLINDTKISFTATLELALDFSIGINLSRDGPQTDASLLINVIQTAVTFQVHQDLNGLNGAAQYSPESNSGDSEGRFDFDARIEVVFHGLDPPNSITLADPQNTIVQEPLIDIDTFGTLDIQLPLSSNISTSASSFVRISSDDAFDPAAIVLAAETATTDVADHDGSWTVHDDLIIGPDETISGNGVIYGDLTQGGVLSPGNSPGITTINGDLTIDNGSSTVIDDTYSAPESSGSDTAGEIVIEIGGLTPGKGPADDPDNGHDQVNVTGHVNIGGTLSVELINNFTPALGQSFQILNYDSAEGVFAIISGLDIGSGLKLSPRHDNTGFHLDVVTASETELSISDEITAQVQDELLGGLQDTEHWLRSLETHQELDRTLPFLNQSAFKIVDLSSLFKYSMTSATKRYFDNRGPNDVATATGLVQSLQNLLNLRSVDYNHVDGKYTFDLSFRWEQFITSIDLNMVLPSEVGGRLVGLPFDALVAVDFEFGFSIHAESGLFEVYFESLFSEVRLEQTIEEAIIISGMEKKSHRLLLIWRTQGILSDGKTRIILLLKNSYSLMMN